MSATSLPKIPPLPRVLRVDLFEEDLLGVLERGLVDSFDDFSGGGVVAHQEPGSGHVKLHHLLFLG